MQRDILFRLAVPVIASATVVYAAVPNTFQSGDLLSSQKLNENFGALVDIMTDQVIAGQKTWSGLATFNGNVLVENQQSQVPVLHVNGITQGADGSGLLRLESLASVPRQWDFNIKSGALVLGDNTAGRDRLAITTSGNVGIGTNSPAVTLQVVGDIRVGTAGTNGCVQNIAGTGLVGTCSSDARLKQSVVPITGALDKLTRLRPVTYEWRRTEFPERHFGAGRSPGLIAQEVEAIMPELVSSDADGYKAVSYGVPLEMLSIEAIKELRDQNAALQKRVASLEARLRQPMR